MVESTVEVQTFFSKLTTDKEHIAMSSKVWAQETIDARARDGWRLASTTATSFGLALYLYLFFERDARA